MTVQSAVRKAGPFISGTSLPFDFKVFAKQDIQIIYTDSEGVESTLVLDSDYTVSLSADQDNNPGGTATLGTAIASGDNAVIIGDLAYDQGTDIRNQSGFEPEIVEDALDRVTILVQQLLEMANRTLRLPASSSTSISTQLPLFVGSQLLGISPDGNGFQFYPLGQSPQDAGSTIFLGGAGAFPRSVESRLRDFISILDFIPESEHAAIRAGTSAYDCKPALLNAIASVVTPGPGFTVAGPAIMFPPGDYKFNGFIDLKRQIRITGSSAGMPDGQPTKLIFPLNSEGFIINTFNTINGGVEATPTLGADGTIIENVTIQGGGGTNANAHGIWLRGRATIRNVTVRDFRGNNIHVVASAGGGGSQEGNCNNFRLDTIRTIQSGRNGLFVDGADANAGTIIGVDATSNAEWGIWDSSFLGNTYLGCHVDNNTLGSFRSDDANARNVFVGCYSESGHPASEIKAPAMVIGGLHGAGFTAATNGTILYEDSLYGARIGTSTQRKSGKFTQVDLTENFGVGTENPGESVAFGTNRILDMKGPANDVAGYFIQRTLNNSVETRYFTEGGVSPRTVVMAVTAHRLELGTSNTPRIAIDSTPGHITPGADNTQNLGSASFRFNTVFAGTGTINTSDARQKQKGRLISDKERAVAIKAKALLKTFKFNDSVESKGDKARIHFGIYAQELKSAFEFEGLVAENYAMFCYDEWEETPEVIMPVLDKKGKDTGKKYIAQKFQAAGNRYGVRYDQLMAFILAAL